MVVEFCDMSIILHLKVGVSSTKHEVISLLLKQYTYTKHISIFEEGGAYCFAHVGQPFGTSVSLNLVQPITQERFAPEISNLVGS